MSQIISHCSNVIAQGHYFTIIVAMVGSQCQVNIRQHRHCRLFAGTSLVIFSVTALWGKHIHRILTVRKNLRIYLIYRITGNIRRFSRFKRLQAQRHPSVQTNQNIIIMCTQEISLTHATGLYLIGDRCWRQIGKHDVATSDPNPRRTPYIQGKAVIALGNEIGSLNSLQTVSTSSGSYFTVACNDVEAPNTLVIHIRWLKSLVAGSSQCHSNLIRHFRLGIDAIFRIFIQEVVARCQCQHGRHKY